MAKSKAVEKKWRDAIAKLEASELSVAEYCRREGLSEKSVYMWRRRLNGTSQHDEPRNDAPAFVEVVGSSESRFMLELPGGTRLQIGAGFDGVALRRLLEVLEVVR